MKRLKTWILTVILLFAAVFGAASCSKSNEGVLTIRYYSGGLGEQWLVDSLEDYKAEMRVKINADDKALQEML